MQSYQGRIHTLRTTSQITSRKKVMINKHALELNTSLIVAPKVLVSQCESPKTMRNRSQKMFYFEDLSKIRKFSTISSRVGFRDAGSQVKDHLVPCNGKISLELVSVDISGWEEKN